FTAIHAAAETGQLEKIPAAQLTTDLLLTRNDNGDTPLHAAAFEGHLDQVPAGLLTPDIIGTRNYDGLSVVRTAFNRDHMDQIPAESRPRAMNPLRRLLHNLGKSKAPW
ncbi:MAG: ankyrin repeat domain-containing protein, partial [Opitutus sp.]